VLDLTAGTSDSFGSWTRDVTQEIGQRIVNPLATSPLMKRKTCQDPYLRYILSTFNACLPSTYFQAGLNLPIGWTVVQVVVSIINVMWRCLERDLRCCVQPPSIISGGESPHSLAGKT